MKTTTVIIIAVLVVLVLLVLYVIKTYNLLVKARNKVKDQWAQIDVLLKRRADLIPNIVETVKGYATHEKDTLDAVITARNKAVSATSTKDEISANGELSNALGRLFAVAEAYPELKANENFLDLQKQLGETEDKISYSRQFYNDTALSYNNQVETFPSNIIAGMFKFEKAEFFNATEKDREVPEVKF